MISFRYHIVSIVSVFLALAVGVALGGGPLKGEVDNTLVNQVQNDRQVKTQLRARISQLRSSNGFTDDFAKTVAPSVVGGSLRHRVVSLVVLPSARQADVTALKGLVEVAGGTVGGTLQVGAKLLDSGNKQLVDALGNQLEARAPNLSVPADATVYERLGDLVARAIGTERRGGARVDGPATSILAGLSAASLMSAEGDLSRRGDLVLVVAGTGQSDAGQQQAASTILTTMVQAVDAHTAGVVLAGPAVAARDDGPLAAVRDDVDAARHVSTVDSVSRTAAQVVTMLALAGQADGTSGQYGGVDAADGAMPGAANAAG